MNNAIFVVMDNLANPNKYRVRDLKENELDASEQRSEDGGFAAWSAAHAAHALVAYGADYDLSYWLKEYFKETGESEQDYIDAINKDKR